MTERRETGRPRKAKSEQRSAWIPPVRVTDAERHHADELAAKAGISLQEFCRRAYQGIRITAPRQRADDALLVELNRIGVNLNQIARAVNRGRGLPDDFPEVLAELRSAIAEMAGDGS